MILEEKNGLRTLTPKSSRYIIHIKATDTYHEKVYLGKYATLDEFEEIDKLTLDEYDKDEVILNEITEKVTEKVTEKIAETQDEQDSLIIDLATQIAILNLTL